MVVSVPYYYMLGQNSAFLGSISETWLTNEQDGDVDDPESLIDMWHYTNSALDLYDTTPGSVVSNTQSAGDYAVVSMDATMWRHLLTVHGTGYSVVKRTAQGNIGNSGSLRWAKTYAESYAAFAVADTALRAAITDAGNTVNVQGFFLSFGYQEAVTGNSTLDTAFETDLEQLILDLRTDYANSNTPVVLDLPPASVSGYTSAQLTSLKNARKVIKKVAGEGTNVSYVTGDTEVRTSGGVELTGSSTMSMGTKLAKEMRRLVDGKGSVTGIGVPCYILIGDDDVTGVNDYGYLEQGNDDDYDGPITNHKTWNWSNNTWEVLDGTANSNSEADGLANFGPDVSMAVKLRALVHDTETVYVFKLGRNTSSIGNTSASGGSWIEGDADIHTTIGTEWDLAKQALLDTEDVIPDVRGIAICVTHAEVATEALATAYRVNLAGVINSYRTMFGTRTGGDVEDKPPVVICQMPDTGNYTKDWVRSVREQCVKLAAEDPRITVVDMEGLRIHSNDKQLAGAGCIDLGDKIAAAFASYI